MRLLPTAIRRTYGRLLLRQYADRVRLGAALRHLQYFKLIAKFGAVQIPK